MVKERGLPCKKGRRRKQKERKRNRERRKELLDFRCSQENRIRRRLLGQQNQIGRVDNWGGIRGRLGKKNHTPFFPTFSTFLHSHSLFYKNNITLHMCVYIYIYISLPSQSYIHNIKIAYMFHNITISKLHALKVN